MRIPKEEWERFELILRGGYKGTPIIHVDDDNFPITYDLSDPSACFAIVKLLNDYYYEIQNHREETFFRLNQYKELLEKIVTHVEVLSDKENNWSYELSVRIDKGLYDDILILLGTKKK